MDILGCIFVDTDKLKQSLELSKMGKGKLVWLFCKSCEQGFWLNVPYFLEDFKSRNWYCIHCGLQNIQKRKKKAPKDEIKVSSFHCMSCGDNFNIYLEHYDVKLKDGSYQFYCPICGLRKCIRRRDGAYKHQKEVVT